MTEPNDKKNARTLLALLGTGEYKPVRYALGKEVAPASPYVQVAIATLLARIDARPDRIAVLVTQAARDKHWAALAAELGKLGYDERTGTLVAYEIPDGKDESQLWRVFEVVGQAIDGAEQVVFDTTHAFRSLQLVTLLALTFYRNARKIALERVLYGAFEAITRDRAPIFDLTAMLQLPDWAEAAAEWARSGQGAQLHALAKEPSQQFRREHRRSTELTKLVVRIGDLSQVLSLVRHADVNRQATEAQKAAKGLAAPGSASSGAADAQLAPMRALADMLAESLAPIALPPGDAERLDADYLRGQLALSRFYGRCGRMLEAFSVLKELWTSCATRIALAAGALEAQADVLGAKVRTRADRLVRATVSPQYTATGPVPKLLAEYDALCGHLLDSDNLLTTYRNALDHCWVGNRSGPKGLLGKVRQAHEKAAAHLESIIPLVDALEPVASELPPPYFLNLTNHPSSGWSDAQRDAALALAPEVVDLPFPAVDPHARGADLDAIAQKLARDLRPGCTHALVMGEMTLAFRLVNVFESAGIECVATTGPRHVEHQPDGTELRRFQFAGFRGYRTEDTK